MYVGFPYVEDINESGGGFYSVSFYYLIIDLCE